ncbi:terminase [Streptomyces sp. S1A1-8]|uniref:terminase n=1 Tax=unclassified Streptomyces TaxID=2593676 RepID=UPI0011646918|nr:MULTISPECIES: terminase [unclassified Streptomyces]QDO20057.1 terminase [Streptomyces sp. S1A1-8]QDO30182.1 terminase [Streptomyces sp. S1A1-3]
MDFADEIAALGNSGRGIWDSVTADYDLSHFELRQLLEIARCADTLDALDADVRENGVMRDNKPNPATVEARQTRIVFARLCAALALPDLDEDEDAPPRYQRLGTRGPYRLVSEGK